MYMPSTKCCADADLGFLAEVIARFLFFLFFRFLLLLFPFLFFSFPLPFPPPHPVSLFLALACFLPSPGFNYLSRKHWFLLLENVIRNQDTCTRYACCNCGALASWPWLLTEHRNLCMYVHTDM